MVLGKGSEHSSQAAMRSQGSAASTLKPSCFLLSVQCSVNYMRYQTLHREIGFVFDGVAQVYDTVSVLSIFQAGWAEL